MNTIRFLYKLPEQTYFIDMGNATYGTIPTIYAELINLHIKYRFLEKKKTEHSNAPLV